MGPVGYAVIPGFAKMKHVKKPSPKIPPMLQVRAVWRVGYKDGRVVFSENKCSSYLHVQKWYLYGYLQRKCLDLKSSVQKFRKSYGTGHPTVPDIE